MFPFFANEFDKYEITDSCSIQLISRQNEEKKIKIHAKTGFNKLN